MLLVSQLKRLQRASFSAKYVWCKVFLMHTFYAIAWRELVSAGDTIWVVVVVLLLLFHLTDAFDWQHTNQVGLTECEATIRHRNGSIFLHLKAFFYDLVMLTCSNEWKIFTINVELNSPSYFVANRNWNWNFTDSVNIQFGIQLYSRPFTQRKLQFSQVCVYYTRRYARWSLESILLHCKCRIGTYLEFSDSRVVIFCRRWRWQRFHSFFSLLIFLVLLSLCLCVFAFNWTVSELRGCFAWENRNSYEMIAVDDTFQLSQF